MSVISSTMALISLDRSAKLLTAVVRCTTSSLALATPPTAVFKSPSPRSNSPMAWSALARICSVFWAMVTEVPENSLAVLATSSTAAPVSTAMDERSWERAKTCSLLS